MKRLLLAALFSACLMPGARAAWWAENDYATGSNGLKKDSLTLFTNAAPRVTAGLNAAYYRDTASHKDRVYSFRLPLTYSGDLFSVSAKPFIYPVSGKTRAGASGGKVYLLAAVNEDPEAGYLRLAVSGAWASQQARVTTAADPKTFSQSAYEVQVEKSFFNQFFFLASASGFTKPAGVSNGTLLNPAMDQSELAYLGTFRQVTAIPEWAMAVQIARSMKPDFDSHLYAGYSKISYRGMTAANSGITGIKIGLTEKSTLDLAYNFYKDEGANWKNYYKILVQVFF